MIITTSSKNHSIDNLDQSAGNLMGSSETIRKLSVEERDWLAGVLDGDGNFDIRNLKDAKGQIKRTLKQIRITSHPRDARVLYRVKDLLGGTIRNKNKKYLIWTINTNFLMINCLNIINGQIRLKVPGFKESCEYFNIAYIEANPKLDRNTAYLAGLTDTDGSILFNFQSHSIVLTLEFQENIYSSALDLSEVIPGAIPDRISLNKRNQTRDKIFYSIRFIYQSPKDMIHLYEYFKLNRLYSDYKYYRAMQIKRYLELRFLKNSPKNSPEFKLYENFLINFVTHLNENKPLPKFLLDLQIMI